MADPIQNVDDLDIDESDKHVLKKFGGVAEPEEEEELEPLEMNWDATAPWTDDEFDAELEEEENA